MTRTADDVLVEQEDRMHAHLTLLEAFRMAAAHAYRGAAEGSVLDLLPGELIPTPPRHLEGIEPGEGVLLALALSIAEAYEALAGAVRAEVERQEQQREAA